MVFIILINNNYHSEISDVNIKFMEYNITIISIENLSCDF